MFGSGLGSGRTQGGGTYAGHFDFFATFSFFFFFEGDAGGDGAAGGLTPVAFAGGAGGFAWRGAGGPTA